MQKFDVNCFSIQDLEKHLRFKYLSQISFENPIDRQEIRMSGLEKQASHQISLEATQLGSRFIQKIEEAYIPHVSIQWINDHAGYGLFAKEDLAQDSYAGEYTGIVRKNDRRYFEPLNNYCYEYPIPDEIGRSFVIDATQGNFTRFMNHSYHPNLKPIHAFYDGFYHLIFLSLCRIKKGDQLTYNYGQSYWYMREPPYPF
jgi:hypothetical protein